MTDTVTVLHKQSFKCFGVPKFVTLLQPSSSREEDFRKMEGIPISDLSETALDALAQQWLTHLYAAVHRPSPFSITKEV
jgi:hypothetical protein